jgi:pyridoxal phosphate enzyme (YggS family)
MIAQNIARIKENIQTAATASNRTSPVKLIAVSKRKPVSAIKEAIQAGQLDFGENYLQEAVEKITILQGQGIFHFIGPLQSNKAKSAVTYFDLIHTVDRIKIAKAIAKHAANLGKTQKILIQINIGREKQKSGIAPEQAKELLLNMQQFPSLEICGLMALPPYSQNPEASRPYFSALRELGHRLQDSGLIAQKNPLELSMGMSGDYQVAIEEGATMIRVGTAIFGVRD